MALQPPLPRKMRETEYHIDLLEYNYINHTIFMYHNLELTVAQYFTLHTFGNDGYDFSLMGDLIKQPWHRRVLS